MKNLFLFLALALALPSTAQLLPPPPTVVQYVRSTNATALPTPPAAKKKRKPRPVVLPPMPPTPVLKKANPNFTPTVMVKQPRTIQSFSNANTFVIFGDLPKPNFIFKPAGNGPPKELLHTTISYEPDLPVYWGDEVIRSDVVTVTAYQEPDYGVIVDFGDNLIDYSVTAVFSPYPLAQPVFIIWIRPTLLLRETFPKVFFRAYKY